MSVLALAGWNGPVKAESPGSPLVWNTLTNEYTPRQGEFIAHLSFFATNISPSEVVIDGVRTSCGCTAAKMPAEPWRLAPGASGRMDITVDLRGKSGTIYKGVYIQSTNAAKDLLIKLVFPPGWTNTLDPATGDRLWNREMAKADHQAVFKADCVKCHLEPAFGKSGPDLYRVACAICHDTPHRATMVPDLNTLKVEKSTPDYWRNWVAHGKAGTLMPGFAATDGGPLDDSQIDSLVALMLQKYPPVKDKKPGK